MMSSVLSFVGLGPSSDAGSDVPTGPVDSPVELAMLAAWRRQSQQGLINESAMRATLAEEPSQSSLMMASTESADTGGAQTFALAAVANSAPSVSPSQSVPDQVTGAIGVSLNAVDVDGNPLTYTVTGAPASGSLIATAPGQYTYTPTSAARLAAGLTSGADSDTFTVSVSDGQLSTPVTVAVAVLPAVISAPTNTAAVGANPSGVAVSDTKIYVANQASNTVSVIDRANPTATPATIGVVASPRAIALGPQGSNRAYVTGYNGVSVINTATNQVVGTVAPDRRGLLWDCGVSRWAAGVCDDDGHQSGGGDQRQHHHKHLHIGLDSGGGCHPGGDSAQHRWQPRLCGQLLRQFRVGAQHQRYRHADSGVHSRGGRQPVWHSRER